MSDRIRRQLSEAEGYLMLDMAARALQILESREDWATMQFEASFLTGEALRSLGRFREAIRPLELAATHRPTDPALAVALGWCYKRTNKLAQAIDALNRAVRAHSEDALLHYNLACYWSLAGNPEKAVESLGIAFDLEPMFRTSVRDETDFDALRGNPEFERLVSDPATLT